MTKRKKPSEIKLEDAHRPSADLPPREPTPLKAEEKPIKAEETNKRLPEVKTFAFPGFEDIEVERTQRAEEEAVKLLAEINRELKELIFTHPDVGTYQYDFQEAPLDVRYMVAASIGKAGFRVAFDGSRSMFVDIPSIRSAAFGEPADHISKVTPL